jgi:hypothetical protein
LRLKILWLLAALSLGAFGLVGSVAAFRGDTVTQGNPYLAADMRESINGENNMFGFTAAARSWSAPDIRWPDLSAGLNLGSEELYYYWTRENHYSVLPKATLARPLRIYVGGDSIAGGPALGFRELAKTNKNILYFEDVRKSTGVVNSWFFDWETYLQNEISDRPYDVIILSMGGNDWQPFYKGPSTIAGSEWMAEYKRRVEAILASVSRPGRLVIWVGLPAFLPASLRKLPAVVNAITKDIFASRPRSRWVDASEIVSPSGVWVKYLTDSNGLEREVRVSDGVHYQWYGAELVTAAVWQQILSNAG